MPKVRLGVPKVPPCTNSHLTAWAGAEVCCVRLSRSNFSFSPLANLAPARRPYFHDVSSDISRRP